MDATSYDGDRAARVAAAIGEPARARMLYCLLDGRARTSTELALVAGVSPSTASVHLGRLSTDGLVRVQVQGKHHYYAIATPQVADVLEGLSVVAGEGEHAFVPRTPEHLRAARTCYDHIAGTLGVALHDRLKILGWLSEQPHRDDGSYDVTRKGAAALAELGVDVDGARSRRRRLAFACLDWSERRSHIGGAVGAALLELALTRRWVTRDRDSRALTVTDRGAREFRKAFGLTVRGE